MKIKTSTPLYLLATIIILTPIIGVTLKMNRAANQPLISNSNREEKIIRTPAVAGSFYPNDPSVLNQELENCLNQAERLTATTPWRILIAPHAGLTYSGRTAAAAFKQIEGGGFTRVILLGASHRVPFTGAAVFNRGTWQTPLGQVEVDEAAADSLLDNQSDNQLVVANSAAHDPEHSLEMELIFLQKTLNDFKIVPVLLGQTTNDLITTLAAKLSFLLDESTLLVVSTDLSHYPTGAVATQVDSQVISAILTGSSEAFAATINNLENAGHPGLDTCACGQEAVKVALEAARILEITDWVKLHYENSGDVSGDQSRVVGYAAIGASGGQYPENPNFLDEKAQAEVLVLARQTLAAHLNNQAIPDDIPQSPVLQKPLGAFVTLKKDSQLRGCIGRFEPNDPLYKVIQQMVIAAATEDHRFAPVKAEELSQIHIEISAMTPKQKISDWQKIELGKHGVVIQKGNRSGTFLPQVAADTGWSKEEFLSQLCSQKAGLPTNCYQDPEVDLYTFEAQIFEEQP